MYWFIRSATPPKLPTFSSCVTIDDQMALRAAATSSAVGPPSASRASSASMAASSSSAVWPGLATAWIWNTEPSCSDCWNAVTLWAICCS